MHTDLQNLYGFAKSIWISESIQLQISYGFSYTNRFIEPSGWIRNFVYFISLLLKRN